MKNWLFLEEEELIPAYGWRGRGGGKGASLAYGAGGHGGATFSPRPILAQQFVDRSSRPSSFAHRQYHGGRP
jgi:hypothetical protein